jgi:hypothetical protein
VEILGNKIIWQFIQNQNSCVNFGAETNFFIDVEQKYFENLEKTEKS